MNTTEQQARKRLLAIANNPANGRHIRAAASYAADRYLHIDIDDAEQIIAAAMRRQKELS